MEPNKRIKQLSKGMLAKLSLTLALAHDPEVLILDEPTSGLDPLIREEFLDGVLRLLCEGQKTVLFSSHTLSDVQRMAEDVGGLVLIPVTLPAGGLAVVRAVQVVARGTGLPPTGPLDVLLVVEERQLVSTIAVDQEDLASFGRQWTGG